MTRAERNAEKVLAALADGPLTALGISARSGLSLTAVSQAIYWVRNNRPTYITVAELKSGYRYQIADTVGQMRAGAANQFKHLRTRSESAAKIGQHMRRLATSAGELAEADLIEQVGISAKAGADLALAALAYEQTKA